MLLDSGTLTLCKVIETEIPGKMPQKRLQLGTSHYYGEKVIGFGRQYAARGVAENIDMLARIWQDRTARADMVALLDTGEQYRISFVQHLLDDNGLRDIGCNCGGNGDTS